MPLDRSRIDTLLAAALAELTGEWLLVGGAAAAVWFLPDRVTEDIDLIGLGGTQAERLALLELAERQGLAPEALNSAADFFVRRIKDWRLDLEPLLTGSRTTVFRPSVTLFLLLKLGRLSETDLGDCLALLTFARVHVLPWDGARVLAALAALPVSEDLALEGRRQALRAALAAG